MKCVWSLIFFHTSCNNGKTAAFKFTLATSWGPRETRTANLTQASHLRSSHHPIRCRKVRRWRCCCATLSPSSPPPADWLLPLAVGDTASYKLSAQSPIFPPALAPTRRRGTWIGSWSLKSSTQWRSRRRCSGQRSPARWGCMCAVSLPTTSATLVTPVFMSPSTFSTGVWLLLSITSDYYRVWVELNKFYTCNTTNYFPEKKWLLSFDW